MVKTNNGNDVHKGVTMDTSTYVTVTDAAKMLRKTLRDIFPSTKFSVRSNKYAGGASIDVHYSSFSLPAKEVSRVADKFQGCDFDGNSDSTMFRPSTTVDGKSFRFGAHYIFVRNSAEFV